MIEEKLSKLKSGDIIDIEFAGGITKAKVLENYPDKNKIFIKVKFYPFWFLSENVVKRYDSYNFENFDILNPYK